LLARAALKPMVPRTGVAVPDEGAVAAPTERGRARGVVYTLWPLSLSRDKRAPLALVKPPLPELLLELVDDWCTCVLAPVRLLRREVGMLADARSSGRT